MESLGRWSVRPVAGLMVAALVGAACSGSAASDPILAPTTAVTAAAPTTVPPTTVPTTAPPTTLSPEEEAEVELRELAMAYLTYESNDLENGRPESSPELDLSTGRLHDRLVGLIEQDRDDGLYVVGGYLSPAVVSVQVDLDSETARIEFCTDDASYRVNESGEQVGSKWDGGPTFGHFLAVLEGSRWLVEEIVFEEEACEPSDYS